MAIADLPAVQLIERASFTTPWPPQAYRQELETNRLAHYLVAVLGGEIVAYGGIWLMVDEAHITTFAVHPQYRRRRIGERLLLAMLDLSLDRHAREATLEVRLSNLAARRLYEKYGFRPVGIRPRYYSDNQEDALIMTTEPLAAPAMRERIARAPGAGRRLAAALRRPRSGAPARPGRRGRGMTARSSSPSSRAATRRASRLSRTAGGSTPTSSRARSRSTRRPGGSSPRWRRGPTSAGSCPCSTRRSPTAGVTIADVDAVAVTYGPGLAGSLLVGINAAKALAWAHGKPLVPVNHLEGHVYAGWLLDPGQAEHETPPFPLVALVVSGGHTFLVEMRDHLDYRLLGQTVDDAAGEAFDKVGRLLGLGYPGGPAISLAADGAVARDRMFPRAWLRDSYDLSFSGLKTAARRIIAQARADEGLPADERDGAAARARRRRARVGVPGLRGRRAGHEDHPRGRGDGRARDRSRRRRGGERRAPGAHRRRGRGTRASRWSSPGPACAPTTAR